MNPKTILFIFIALFAISLILAITFFVYTLTISSSLVAGEKIFFVKPGDGFRDIADRLESNGFIRNAAVFKFYVVFRGWANKLKAGEYYLSASDAMTEIARKIYEGEKKEEMRLVIPEGFNIFDIDEKLSEAGLIKKGDLVSFKPDKDLEDKYLFLKEIPTSSALHSFIEGFLFPDTYYFFKTDARFLEPIIAKFLDNFNNKIGGELKKEITKRGLNLYDVLIVASLLEKEIPIFDERDEAAGIIWKRLKNNMPLQIDATVSFIKNNLLPQAYNATGTKLGPEDYEIDSPYNTYRYKGFPPAPICNPGLESIKAAVFYKDTDFWYYLSDPITKKTIFSKTYDEHRKNRKKYLGL